MVKNVPSLLGKSAPKKRKLKPVPSLSQLISSQIVQLHVTEVNVIFHGKLENKAAVRRRRGGRARSARTHQGAGVSRDAPGYRARSSLLQLLL